MKKLMTCALLLLLFATCASAGDLAGYCRLRIKGTNVNIRNVPGTEIKDSKVLTQANTGDEFIGASWPVGDGLEWRLIMYTIGKDGKLTFTPCYVHSRYAEAHPLRGGDAPKIAATPYGSRRAKPGTFGEIFGVSWHDIVQKFGGARRDATGMEWPVHITERPKGKSAGSWGWDITYRSPGLTFSFALADDDPFGEAETTVWLRGSDAPEIFGVKYGETTLDEVEAKFSEPHETNTYSNGRTLLSWHFPAPYSGDFWIWFDAEGTASEGGFTFTDPDAKIWPDLLKKETNKPEPQKPVEEKKPEPEPEKPAEETKPEPEPEPVKPVEEKKPEPEAEPEKPAAVQSESADVSQANDSTHDAACGPDGLSRAYHEEMANADARTDMYEAISSEHDRQTAWTDEYIARLREDMTDERAKALDAALAAWDKWHELEFAFLASMSFGDGDMFRFYRGLEERVLRTVSYRQMASVPSDNNIAWKFEPEAGGPRPARDDLARDGSGYSSKFTEAIASWDGNTLNFLEIVQAEIELQEKWLGELRDALMAKLDDEQKAAFDGAETAWLAWRDADADFIYDPDGGSLARMDAIDATLEKIVRRVVLFEELLDRY